jgi:hypothetical protein
MVHSQLRRKVGNLNIYCEDAATGRIFRTIRTRNLVPTCGLGNIRDLILLPETPSGSGWTPNFIAVGTIGGSTVPDTTVLGNEVFRKDITRKIPHQTILNSWKYFLRIESSEANGSGSQILREAGIFTGPVGGRTWARAPFTAVTKSSAIALTLEWIWTETAS